jgi:Alpha/beta hydrolase domain
VNLAKVGYVQHEYVAAGTADSYRAAGGMPENGRWAFSQAGSAAYRTRVLVRYPSDPARFSGKVVVEWLNVSGGVDADPEWVNLYEEIVRQGDAWVGVSAQLIGVSGGPVLVTVPGVSGAAQIAGEGLRKIDPARYGSLEFPGDGYSFDVFTQVARAIRDGQGMDGRQVKYVIAAGESQSAFALVTYYDGVQPLTKEFDGFFVHSRSGAPLPLAAPGQAAGIASAINGTPVIFRTDQPAPVMNVQSESDIVGILDSYAAIQPDNPHFRLWDMVGTSHADAHLLGSVAHDIDCGVPINDGPTNLIAKAALADLEKWITLGQAPPHAPRFDISSGPDPQIERDADGIALGGIRTPPVDVPVDVLSGVPGPNPSVICLLLGSTKPLDAQRLAQLYPSRQAYVARYDADAAKTIREGWVLAADKAALLAMADPSAIPTTTSTR